MADVTEQRRQMADEVGTIIGRNLDALYEGDARAMPVVVDFLLIVATEDATDGDSDSVYALLSPNSSHYRKVGLVSCAKRMLLRDDADGEDGEP